jgi:hypothetical protein
VPGLRAAAAAVCAPVYQGQVEYRLTNSEISIVRISTAGMGMRRVRIANLSPPHLLTCNPTESFMSLQGFLCLFIRIEDIMDLVYVRKKIRRMNNINELHFYKRSTKNNQFS